MPTDMSFSVSRDGGRFEWAGTSLNALFCQRSNLLSPRFWRMMFDIVRFSLFALDILRDEDEHDPWMTIGEYLEREGYSRAFRDDYLLPMAAAVWSTPPDRLFLEFPAVTMIRFL
jgi:predicted NAD/FAD-binding protein